MTTNRQVTAAPGETAIQKISNTLRDHNPGQTDNLWEMKGGRMPSFSVCIVENPEE